MTTAHPPAPPTPPVPSAPSTGAHPDAPAPGSRSRAVFVTAPGVVEVREVPVPAVGPRDVLVAVRACGVCGSDAYYTSLGGLPGREGNTPLGHEVAGEVVVVGDEVVGIALGAHVVVDPMAAPTGIIGNGGSRGGLAEHLLVEDAELGRGLALVPDEVPFAVAALNEPMAVARHAVNRTAPRPGARVVVFGAGPIGLGAAISYQQLGASSVVVVDVVAARLETALRVGATAVVDSSREDVLARLVELHGEAGRRPGESRPGTDVYLDAAGAPAVVRDVLAMAKHGATLGVVGVHKEPVAVDFGKILTSELTIVTAMGYPTEIFEVTAAIAADWERYAPLISHRIPFDDVLDGLATARTPGAADKVVITFP